MYALSARLLALSALFLGAVAGPVPVNDVSPPQPPHPPLDQVYIRGVKFAGSGCPAGSVATSLALDGSNINILFDQYIASVGPGIAITESRKNCVLNIELFYPTGWTLTVFDTEYRGFLALDNKVTALQKSDYWWNGQGQTVSLQSTWTGPKSQDYKFTDSFLEQAFVWADCKGVPGTLSINTQIRVDNTFNKGGSGLITTDVINHKVTHILGFRWRQC